MGDHLGTRVITGSKHAIAGYPVYGGAPFVPCCPPDQDAVGSSMDDR